MRGDFNLFDAFRIFDMDSKGWITLADLKDGLNQIGIFPSHEELDLFVKRYDKNGDHRLRFSDFCDAFLTNDAYYANLLNKRVSNGIHAYARDDCFLASTKLEFRNLWRTHFKNEVFAESLR